MDNSTVLEIPCHKEDCDPFGRERQTNKESLRKLKVAVFLSIGFVFVELAGGFYSGSLAIMTDAAHLLADVAGFGISLMAIKYAQKIATSKMSFGYDRIEVLGVLGSIGMIWIIVGFLFVEAVERIQNPQPINAPLMMCVAGVGVVVNISIGSVLHEHEHDHVHSHSHANINVKAAFIHAVGDLIQSVGVLLAAVLIWFKPEWHLADPVCTITFGLLVLWTTFGLAKKSLIILMVSTPENISPSQLRDELRSIPGIVGVHDLHVWTLVPGKDISSVHLVIDDWSEKDCYGRIMREAHRIMCSKGIHHSTIQIDPPVSISGDDDVDDFGNNASGSAILHCRTSCCGDDSNNTLNEC